MLNPEEICFVTSRDFILRRQFEERGITVVACKLNLGKLLKTLVFKLGFAEYTFGESKPLFKKKKLIILGEDITQKSNINWFKNNFPESCIVLWMNNAIADPKYFINVKKHIPVFTFDKHDAKRFGLFWAPQHYPMGGRIQSQEGKGAIFIGRDKGRYDLLFRLKQQLIRCGIPVNMIIYRDNTSAEQHASEFNAGPALEYEEVLKLTQESAIILDIVGPNQVGLSLRPFEALKYNKKLITNNEAIKECSFYHPDNCLIWSEKTLSDDLFQFVNTSLKHTPNEELIKHDTLVWAEYILSIAQSENW